MFFERSKYFGTGVCPVCKKSTKANVHAQCGVLREKQRLVKRRDPQRFASSSLGHIKAAKAVSRHGEDAA